MLRIAVTGPVGAGKTTLLARLALWCQARGRRVVGLLAEAHWRDSPARGARAYTLRFVPGDEVAPLAERLERRTPGLPYHFHEEAFRRAAGWANDLAASHADGATPPYLVVLDEFGKLEADGVGLAPIWPAIAACGPDVVAISVRAGLVSTMALRLGAPFDLVVDADDPAAWPRLVAACGAVDDWGRVGFYGAGAGAAELTLGAALHAGMVPARGLVMASLQAAMLAAAGVGLERRDRVVWVAFVAAGLKALSPAGSRLRPMLGITVQGLLFGLVTRFLGWSLPAVALASGLVGAWAAAQGILLAYLFMGQGLVEATRAAVDWAARTAGLGAPGVAAIALAWIATWALVSALAGAVVFTRARTGSAATEVAALSLVDRLTGLAGGHGAALAFDRGPETLERAMRGAVHDLVRPGFWLPLALVATILLASGAGWEAAFWMAARAATIAFLLFAAARRLDLPGVARWLRRRGHWGPALALERAVARMHDAAPTRS